jgi:hypothetical protein
LFANSISQLNYCLECAESFDPDLDKTDQEATISNRPISRFGAIIAANVMIKFAKVAKLYILSQSLKIAYI